MLSVDIPKDSKTLYLHIFFALLIIPFLLPIAITATRLVLQSIGGFLFRNFRRFISYPVVFRRYTRLHILTFALLVASNIFLVSFRISGIEEFKRRTAHLSLITLSPLYISEQVLSICGLCPRGYRRFHKWIGVMAATHALIHAFLQLARPNRSSGGDRWGTIVSIYTISPYEQTGKP